MKSTVYLTLLIAFTLIPASLSAQTAANSFQVTSLGTASSADPYISAIQQSDFENHRLLNKRIQLSFDNGLTIELLSAAELLQAGILGNTEGYRTDNPENYVPPVLHLGPNGMIAAEYPIRKSKS